MAPSIRSWGGGIKDVGDQGFPQAGCPVRCFRGDPLFLIREGQVSGILTDKL
jgi:hypothetical protein